MPTTRRSSLTPLRASNNFQAPRPHPPAAAHSRLPTAGFVCVTDPPKSSTRSAEQPACRPAGVPQPLAHSPALPALLWPARRNQHCYGWLATTAILAVHSRYVPSSLQKAPFEYLAFRIPCPSETLPTAKGSSGARNLIFSTPSCPNSTAAPAASTNSSTPKRSCACAASPTPSEPAPPPSPAATSRADAAERRMRHSNTFSLSVSTANPSRPKLFQPRLGAPLPPASQTAALAPFFLGAARPHTANSYSRAASAHPSRPPLTYPRSRPFLGAARPKNATMMTSGSSTSYAFFPRSFPPPPPRLDERSAAHLHRERPYLAALLQCTKPAGLGDACLKALLQ